MPSGEMASSGSVFITQSSIQFLINENHCRRQRNQCLAKRLIIDLNDIAGAGYWMLDLADLRVPTTGFLGVFLILPSSP